MGDNNTVLYLPSHHDDARVRAFRCNTVHSPTLIATIDAAVNITGLVVRGLVYGVVGGLLSHSDNGLLVLMGLFAGDALASLIHIFWDEAGHTGETITELVVLTLVFVWLGSDMQWSRVFTAGSGLFWMIAIGILCVRLKRGLLKPVGPNDYGWS